MVLELLAIELAVWMFLFVMTELKKDLIYGIVLFVFSFVIYLNEDVSSMGSVGGVSVGIVFIIVSAYAMAIPAIGTVRGE